MKKIFTNDKYTQTIDGIKNTLVDYLLLLYAIISLPVLLLSVSRATVTGWLAVYSVQIVIFVFFITIFFLRKKLTYKTKAYYSGLILLVLCLSGIHCLGLFSGIIPFYVLFVVLVAFVAGRRYGYAALFLLALSYAVYALLYGFGVLDYDFDIQQMVMKKNLWISEGLILLVVAYSLILMVTRLEKAYMQTLKKTEKRESEYRLLFEQAAEGIMITDREGKVLMVNNFFKNMSGYRSNDIIGKNVSDFVIPDMRERVIKGLQNLSPQKTRVSLMKVINKKNEERVVEVRVSLFPDSRIQILLSDITLHQQIQKEIEEQKAFGKSIIDTLPGVFYIFENHKNLIQWNDGLVDVSKYSSDELSNILFENLFVDTRYDYESEIFTRTRNSNTIFFRTNLLTKTGEKIPFYHSAIAYERNDISYFMGIGHDISSLVRTEQALKNSEENFKNIYNNTSDAIFIFDQNLKVLSANETFFELTGLNHEDMQNINIFDYIFDFNSMRKVAGEIEKAHSGRVVVAEYLIRNKQGESFPVEIRSRRINYRGQPAVVTAFNEISARKELEKKVYEVSLKAEENERGRIAKDLHDGLGPLLSTCKIYLHNLKKAQFDEREQASFTKLSQLIDESLMGIKEISNNLSPHVLRNFGLVNALNVFIEKVASVSEAKIHYKFDAGQKYNEIVELTLYRVVTELINNTIKHAQAKNIYIELLQKEEKLQLIYADDGKGFDSDHIDKPGLGILNIKSRIKSIAGKIDFDASVGKGVKVVIETNI